MKANVITTPNGTNKINLETLSLKVAEIQSVLAFLGESDEIPHKEALTVSVLERLANWLQDDIEALIAAGMKS